MYLDFEQFLTQKFVFSITLSSVLITSGFSLWSWILFEVAKRQEIQQNTQLQKHWANFIPSISSTLRNFTAGLEKNLFRDIILKHQNEPALSIPVSDFRNCLILDILSYNVCHQEKVLNQVFDHIFWTGKKYYERYVKNRPLTFKDKDNIIQVVVNK